MRVDLLRVVVTRVDSTDKNRNASGVKPIPDKVGSQTSKARPGGAATRDCKQGRDKPLKKKRRPARHLLVARSIKGTRKQHPTDAGHRKKLTVQQRKRFQRKLLRKQRRTRRGEDRDDSQPSTSARAQELSATIEEPSRSHPYFLRKLNEDDDQSPKPRRFRSQLKRQKKSGRLLDLQLAASSTSGLKVSKPDYELRPQKRATRSLRRKPPTPTKVVVSSSNEWPSLAEVSGKVRPGAKEAAEDVMLAKQTGTAKKLKRQQATSIDRFGAKLALAGVATEAMLHEDANLASTSAASSQTTWAGVASGSLKNSSRAETRHDRPRQKETKRLDSNDYYGSTKPGNFVTNGDDIGEEWIDCSKLTRQASQKQNRKQLGQRFKGKRLNYLRSVRKMKSPQNEVKLYNFKEACTSDNVVVKANYGLNTEGKLFQDEKATSKNSNGDQNWYIDNMSVIYTKPVASVISLREPRRTNRRKGVNRCNNRSVSPHSQIRTSNFLIKPEVSSVKPSQKGHDSGDELSALMCNVSVHSKESLNEEIASTSQGTKSTDHQYYQEKLPPRCSKHRRQEISKSNEGLHGNEVKKISVKYRALKRFDGNRLDAKTLTEHQARVRRSDNIQENMMVTRSSQRRLRRQRQEQKHSDQRSPMQGPAPVTREAPQRLILTSTDSAESLPDQGTSADSKNAKKKKHGDEMDKATNNINQEIAAATPSGESILHSTMKSASSHSILEVCAELALKEEVDRSSSPSLSMSDHSLDTAWWINYLEGNDTTMCEMVPLDLPDGLRVSDCMAVTCQPWGEAERSC